MSETTQWLDDLEARAKAATPGPWHVVIDEDRNDSAYAVCAATPMFIPFNGINRKHDSSFIAAANPETVLRLVAMVRHLAANAGENPDGDLICAYHELGLKGTRCPLFKDQHHELGENASDDEWYSYAFGEKDGDEIPCSTDTSICWIHAAYKNTEPTS